MSVVEIEFSSNTQLLIFTFLMFVGGDIFISIVALQCSISKLNRTRRQDENKPRNLSPISSTSSHDRMEVMNDPEKSNAEIVVSESDSHLLKCKSIQLLFFVVIGYVLVNHILGFIMIPIYLAMFPSTKDVLKRRRLNPFTFVLFTTVSSFTNCGFIPTNGNMIVFKKNSGLLLILISQILVGNTLYPPCLRFCVWFFGKFFMKAEAKYLLESRREEIRYFHWLPARNSKLLLFTVIGFFLVQFVMFCCMGWNSEGLRELNNYERVIGVLFQVVNSRYSGETILDLWKLAPAVWVLFIFMM
ncbi:hypothetical protein L6452_27101 [Arctium lappa]|uniref:Uncharacterized protein n=1 Tax=Arctium lappa TaxID=4217 RepID=A0ACB9A046_ARCLA|nr:hypothetical protein L6452_27101 [Arctium lappa]